MGKASGIPKASGRQPRRAAEDLQKQWESEEVENEEVENEEEQMERRR